MAESKLDPNDIEASFSDDDERPAPGDSELGAVSAREREPAKAEREGAEGEDSGLADILGVAAALKKKKSNAPQADLGVAAAKREDEEDDDLLGGVGGGFGAASAVAVVEVQSAAKSTPRATTPAAGSNKGGGAGLKWAAALVIAAVAGLGYFVAGDRAAWTEDEPVAARAPTPGESPTAGPKEPETVDAPREPPVEEEPGVGELLALAEGDGAAVEAELETAAEPVESEPEPKEADDRKARAGKRGSSKAGAKEKPADQAESPAEKSAEEAEPPAPAPAPIPDQTSKNNPEAEVDCLLNPDLPGCKKEKREQPKREDDGPALPDKLSQNALRSGFQSVKPVAKECGQKNAVAPGTKVKVHVTIEGATGKVTKAKAEGEFANTSVGRCIENAVRRASFDRFEHQVMGITWPFRL